MTEKLYDSDSYKTEFDATVISCEKCDDGYRTLLDRTLFFPNEGGQECDTGSLNGIEIKNVEVIGDEIYHYSDSPFEIGSNVQGKIDFEERYRKMQNHTGEHILSGLAHTLYGCENVGFHLGKDNVTMDLDKPLNRDELKLLEEKANMAIYANSDITACYPAKEDLDLMQYRCKSDISGKIRIVKIDGIDTCACCAPHVAKTGEIGIIKILGFINYKGGVRLNIACGFDAFADYDKRLQRNIRISTLLSAKQEDIVDAVEQLIDNIAVLKNEIGKKNEIITNLYVNSIANSDDNICLVTDSLSNGEMRHIANGLKEKTPKLAAVFSGDDQSGYSYIITSKELDLKDVANDVNKALSGRGGGRGEMIQGSVKASKEEIEEYFIGM